MAYRLMKYADMEQEVVRTPASVITDNEEGEEDDAEVIEELEETQLGKRLESLEQENKSLKELLSKLEHSRSWLEERVDVLEQIMKNRKFSKDIKDVVATEEDFKSHAI